MEQSVINHKRIEICLLKVEHYSEILDHIQGSIRQIFNGEVYLTDKELSEILKLGRRTLQEYRKKKILPYIHLEGKILYKESDILKILEENYSPADNEDDWFKDLI